MTDRPAQHASLDARTDLLWIVDQWPTLQAALTPGGGKAHSGMPAGGGDAPLPINVQISDLLHVITDRARFYGRALMEETDWTPTTSKMPTLLREIAERSGHFTEAETRMAIDFCDDVETMRADVEGALKDRARRRYMGDCQAPECTGDLFLPATTDHGTCPKCQRPFTWYEQTAILEAELSKRLMTQSEIVSALFVLGHEVPISTVKSWVRRGKLKTPDVPFIEGSGLFAFSDAIGLVAARGEVA